MEGLLGGFDYEQERKRNQALALMMAGLNFAGARKGQEMQALGPAFASGVGTYLTGMENTRRNATDFAKLKLLDEEQRAKQAAAQAQAQFQGELGNIFSGGPDLSQMGPGGPTPENAARVEPDQIAKYRRAAALAASRGQDEMAKRLTDIANSMKKKYSQTPQIGVGADGKPYQFVLDDDGNEKRLTAGVAPKFREVNTGGKVQIVNDYALPASGTSFDVTMNPFQSGSLAVDQGRLGLSREQFNYQKNKDAAAAAAGPKPPAPEKPSDQQLKAAAFLQRMTAASDVINRIEAGGFTPGFGQGVANVMGSVPVVGGATGAMATTARNFFSPESAQYENAQDAWITAKLRPESGAVIGKEEMASERRIFFPQPTDPPEVVEQKRQMRAQVERSMATQARGAYQEQQPAQPLQKNTTALVKAREAIKAGKDPAAVRARLREMGFSDEGL